MDNKQEILTTEERNNGFAIVTDNDGNITVSKWGKPFSWFSAVVYGGVVGAFLEVVESLGGVKGVRKEKNVHHIR